MPLFDFTTGAMPSGATLTRASTGWFFDVLNTIRNPTMAGAVIGTPGTNPTNWVIQTTFGGLTKTIVELGTENGISYIDLKWSGTANITSALYIYNEAISYIVGLTGETWATSAYMKLISGSVTGFSNISLQWQERTAAGVYIRENSGPDISSQLDGVLTKYEYTGTNSGGATVGIVQSGLKLSITNGIAVDITIRYGYPSMGNTTTLASAANNVPRFTRNNITNLIDGLLNEPSMTNIVRNSSALGAVGGAPPGTPPTYWGPTSTINNITRTIIGNGVEDGIPYLEIKYAGTPNAATTLFVAFDSGVVIPALQGQTWLCSTYTRLFAGSLANTTMTYAVTERSGTGTSLGGSAVIVTPTNAPLKTQRTDSIKVLVAATTAFVLNQLQIACTLNNPVDFTLRIGLPQLGQVFLPTSPIVTTTVGVARAADILTLPTINGNYNVDVTTTIGTTRYTNQIVSGGVYVVPTNPYPIKTVNLTKTLEVQFDFELGILPPNTTVTRTGSAWHYGSSNVNQNPMMVGAALGQVNYGGMFPNYWAHSGTPPGGIVTVLGFGFEDNIPYIDFRYGGTGLTHSTSYSLNFALPGDYPSTFGQIWTFSCYIRLLAGTFGGIIQGATSPRVSIRSQSTGTVYGDSFLNINTDALKYQKFTVTGSPTDAAITSLVPILFFGTNSGQTSDLTIRVGMPWLSTPSNGLLLTDTPNTPRFQSNLLSGAYEGILNEAAQTHYLANSSFTGGNPGVSSPPGFTSTGANNGTTLTFIASGTEDGIPWAEWRFYSPTVPSATSVYGLQAVITPAVQGQTWSLSQYVKLTGGSLTGVTFSWGVQERAGATITATDTPTIIPTTAPLRTQFYSKTRTLTGATTDTIRQTIFVITYTINVAFDIQFRVGLPQMMQLPVLPSPILTTNAGAVTRNDDQIAIGLANGTYDVDIQTSAGVTRYPSQAVSSGSLLLAKGLNPIQFVDVYETGGFDFTTGTMPQKSVVARSGTAWTFGSDVKLASYTANQPRFRYNVDDSTCDGLLSEDVSVNSLRNSNAQGAVLGEISAGNPGAYPTFWNTTGTLTGLTREIVGIGSEDNIPYVDIHLYGVPGTTSLMGIYFDAVSQIPALDGQTWTESVYVKLIAGTLTNISSIRIVIVGRTDTGVTISGQSSSAFFTPTTAPLKTQRYQITRTNSHPTVGRVSADFRIDFAIGLAIDLTVRIGLPMMELNLDCSSPIVTTGVAITRPKGLLTLTVPNNKYNVNIQRVAGTTIHQDEVITTNSFVVPNSVSPVKSVTFDTLSAASATGSGAATSNTLTAFAVQGASAGSGLATSITGGEYRVNGLAEGAGFADGITPDVIPVDNLSGVKYWEGFPGPAGYVDIPQARFFPIQNAYSPLNLRDTRGFAYLLRAFLPNKVLGTEALTTIYLAASMGRSTEPTDTPPNVYVPGLLLNSTINYQVALFSGIEPVAESRGGQGAIVLLDPRGTLDSLVNESWDGARLDILQGEATAKFNTYRLVDKLTTAGILYNQRKKEIRLRDQAWKLQQANLHDNIYAGTGLAEGPIELKGTYKPYGVGVVKNVLAQLINAPFQIYQISCSSVASIDAIRDGGIDLSFSGLNYSNYAALAAAANAGQIPAGKHSTCLAQGLFALGAKPVFGVTVDFKGDADLINGTGYGDTIAKICRRIATGRGNVKLVDGDLDFISLNKLEQIQPNTCGWFFKDQITKADALTLIMNSRLGWWATLMNGLTAFGVIELPVDDPAMVINYPMDFSGEPDQLETYQVPRSQTYVGYSFNYTKQDPSALAGSLDAATIAIYAQDSFWANQASTVPLWKQPTAQVFRVQSGFVDLTSAQTEATRQQAIMGVRRERWTIPVPCAPFSDVLGKVIQVNNFPRYGWPASKKFICIGVSFASGIAVKLTLWG